MTGDLTATIVSADNLLREVRREVARLSAQLAGLELELSDTRLALSRFEGHYHARVGRSYAELDEILARIAALHAADAAPEDARSGEARRAREQADRSAGEYRRRTAEPQHTEPKPIISEEVKKLYRRIAARIHPDRAGDEESRSVRNRLMAELNEAYARGDVGRMHDISSRWGGRGEAEEGGGDELARLAATRDRLKSRIGAIERELARIRMSPLAVLMAKVREAEAAGRDILETLLAELELKISLARRALRELEEERGGTL